MPDALAQCRRLGSLCALRCGRAAVATCDKSAFARAAHVRKPQVAEMARGTCVPSQHDNVVAQKPPLLLLFFSFWLYVYVRVRVRVRVCVCIQANVFV